MPEADLPEPVDSSRLDTARGAEPPESVGRPEASNQDGASLEDAADRTESDLTPGGEPDVTGDARVDAAVTRLSGLDAVDVDQAPEVYTAVYDELASVLKDDGAGTGR